MYCTSVSNTSSDDLTLQWLTVLDNLGLLSFLHFSVSSTTLMRFCNAVLIPKTSPKLCLNCAFSLGEGTTFSYPMI
jgi:hypothetical protein